ncbi:MULTISPECIES: ABC transporter permease [Bacillaceae]|uniref:ABC transporter permease n=1 Tax=Bacillaceae TaxID=186817 RepID=UPI001C58B2C4|nr:ABC transporter permease [Rossellomorea sp. YZS02]MBW3114649.1 ABC transporter permease [Bacillus sp. MCCB 382]MDX8345694.1 ABC transporter permease [Rossellomorea sp. YZS02]
MWAIAKMELKKNVQDKGLWFWTFILPIVFIIAFVSIFSGDENTSYKEVVTQIIPGYTIMFAFYIMISMVIGFVKDRDKGMVARIASTPLPIKDYFIGKWIPFMMIVLIQIAVLFCFGVVVYDLPLGDPLALISISLSLAFIVTGWGMALSVLVKTENMGIAMTQIVALGGAMLGGLWLPVELMPEFMQSISKVLPQYWAIEGYKEIILEGGSVADVFFNISILIFSGAVGGMIAIARYPRFLRSSKS